MREPDGPEGPAGPDGPDGMGRSDGAKPSVRSDDRRRTPRAPLQTWVEITTESGRRRGSVENLSMGGLGIARRGQLRLEPGQRVLSEFPLPGIGLPVELEAVVVWSDAQGGRAGLRFVEVDPGLAELVARYASGALGD